MVTDELTEFRRQKKIIVSRITGIFAKVYDECFGHHYPADVKVNYFHVMEFYYRLRG
jgi:hypothetical protein